MNNKVMTTVIGSYPVGIDNYDLIKNYHDQKLFSWDKYIKSAVKDMVNSGIKMVSDGQTRDPFLNIFYRKLEGCRIRERPEVIDKIRFKEPITLDDQKYVRNIIPKNTKLIGLVAGPYTMSMSCSDLFYKDEKEMAYDFAYALKEEVKALKQNVDMISIDEPYFSVSMPDYARDLIQIIVRDVSLPIRLHSCGDISNIIPELLDLPIDILSHEFKATPKLFDAFKEYNIKKKICLGSVRSDKNIVEPVDDIIKHIKKGIDVFGDNIAQIAPDCGLRLQPRAIAFQKLKNLVEAGEKVYGG